MSTGTVGRRFVPMNLQQNDIVKRVISELKDSATYGLSFDLSAREAVEFWKYLQLLSKAIQLGPISEVGREILYGLVENDRRAGDSSN